jgi:hypothetical protein
MPLLEVSSRHPKPFDRSENPFGISVFRSVESLLSSRTAIWEVRQFSALKDEKAVPSSATAKYHGTNSASFWVTATFAQHAAKWRSRVSLSLIDTRGVASNRKNSTLFSDSPNFKHV